MRRSAGSNPGRSRVNFIPEEEGVELAVAICDLKVLHSCAEKSPGLRNKTRSFEVKSCWCSANKTCFLGGRGLVRATNPANLGVLLCILLESAERERLGVGWKLFSDEGGEVCE